MDGNQYDLFLALLDEYELDRHEKHLQAAQRMQRHNGLGGEDYEAELDSIKTEKMRRAEEARLGMA